MPQAQLALLVLRGQPGQSGQPVLLELSDLRVQQVFKVLPVLALPVLQASRVTLDKLVLRVLRDQLVLLAQPDPVESKASRVSPDQLGTPAPRERLAQVRQEQLELLVPQVQLDLLDQSARRAQVAHTALRALREQRALLDQPVLAGLKELQVLPEQLAPLAEPEVLVPLALVLPEAQVLRVRRVRKDLSEPPVLRAVLDSVQQALPVPPGLQDPLVLRDQQDPSVRQDPQDSVLPVLLVRREPREPEPQVRPALRDLKVPSEPRALRALPELAKSVLPECKDLLVLDQ